ncbi:uncharacterized protein LOC124113680 isoform X2 [Haliotis rufescens]|uniref:uncharacterized protein LOC124113680 isoform X2 n=1 Tax=Haliotis rufescens TaxID=6454 RepID=UPI00201FA504|nr:uncharacterized protein LOC124113680 isoform X2 [Haliotis rufescens]
MVSSRTDTVLKHGGPGRPTPGHAVLACIGMRLLFITVVVIVAEGAGLQLHSRQLSVSLWQINCTLDKVFSPGDTMNILGPPSNISMIFCKFPLQCLDDFVNVSWGPQNKTFSMDFTPKSSGLYVCVYNEEHGAIATGEIHMVDPAETTTNLPEATSTDLEADTSTGKDDVTSGSGFIDAFGILVTLSLSHRLLCA